MLSVRGLSKSYHNTPVVQDVSFEISGGERLILLGTSGSGKSTILKMINGLISADSGIIDLDGQDISSIEPYLLRRRMGYVIQNVGLFPHYSVAKNISLVPTLLNWQQDKINQRTDELLRLVGLNLKMKARMPDQLSGGQQQRVGIARALAANPQVLLMDEPFGALDPITRKEIQQEFMSLRNNETAIVLVTHDVKEAFLLGDQICLLDGGKVQQVGSPRELLFQPANAFVKDFLSAHFVELELSLVRMRHLIPFLSEVEGDIPYEMIDGQTSIYEAMQMTSNVVVEGTNHRLVVRPDEIAALYFSNQSKVRSEL